MHTNNTLVSVPNCIHCENSQFMLQDFVRHVNTHRSQIVEGDEQGNAEQEVILKF